MKRDCFYRQVACLIASIIYLKKIIFSEQKVEICLEILKFDNSTITVIGIQNTQFKINYNFSKFTNCVF